MGADLNRAAHGLKTVTGMGAGKLKEFARKPVRLGTRKGSRR
jgi:hypothetical protein